MAEKNLVDRAKLERIWEILKEHCGAGDFWKDNFISVAQGWGVEFHDLEYRFQGALGFGGKIWIERNGSSRVTCYPEDETPERRRMIDAANAALKSEGLSAS